MVKSFNVGKKVMDAGAILGALGVIGFLGLIWLMIYGNMSGNLGFSQDSATTTLQELTLANNSIVTLTGTSGKTNPSVNTVIVINATGGETLLSGNYTLTDTTITGSSTMTIGYNGTAVNISYVTNFDSSEQLSTESIITNMSGGFLAFFGFSETFFIIAAIVLLIFMLVGLLALVMMIVNAQKGKGFAV